MKKPSAAAITAAYATLRRDAELVRLANVMDVALDELAFLADADEGALRDLRYAVSDHMFERESQRLHTAAKLAGLLPAAVAAKLAEHALGPLLSARTVPLVSAELIAGIGERLPAGFIADAAVHLDLRRAGPLVNSVSKKKMAEAGAELARRGEYVVLAAFVGYLDDEVLIELLSIFDAETMLQAAFLIEQPERVDALLASLDDQKVTEFQYAARKHELWEESFVVLLDLGDEQRDRFIKSLAAMPADHHATLRELLASNATIWAAAAPLMGLLDAETRAAIEPK